MARAPQAGSFARFELRAIFQALVDQRAGAGGGGRFLENWVQ